MRHKKNFSKALNIEDDIVQETSCSDLKNKERRDTLKKDLNIFSNFKPGIILKYCRGILESL